VGTGLNRISPPEVVKLDILDTNDIHRVLDDVEPHVVVHCAANRFPDSCTADPIAARKINVDSSRALAEATTVRGIFLIYISTDYVFSGRPGEAPYQPSSAPDPPNVYVHSTMCEEAFTETRLSDMVKPSWKASKQFSMLLGSQMQ
jgi:S-adenosylmethionine synthetase